jgi:hypothetical protein
MRTDVGCFCLIVLGLASACRQSGPPSNDVSESIASMGDKWDFGSRIPIEPGHAGFVDVQNLPPSEASAGATGQPGVAVAATAEPAAAAPWPVTCDEAAARAIEKMGPGGVEQLRALAKDELIELHFSPGLNIRNGFGLWDGNQALLDSCAKGAGSTPEPDTVSMMIITRAWEIVHGERKAANGSK